MENFKLSTYSIDNTNLCVECSMDILTKIWIVEKIIKIKIVLY
jgi:hypothetical protein